MRRSLALITLLAACAPPLSAVELAQPAGPVAAAPAPSASVAAEPAPAPSAEAPPAPAASAEAAAPEAEKPGACAPPDRGWGRYLPYKKIPGARVSLPVLEGEAPGAFDLYIHFHASDAARRGFVHEAYPAVFVGVDIGEGSGAYRKAFDDPSAFTRLLTRVTEALREHAGPGAKLGKIYLSSWSAGFGATTRIAKMFPDKIHGLVLLDSLYAPFAKDEEGNDRKGVVFEPAVRSVLAFARRALAGERVLFLSYSDVPTEGYASTGEVARYLVEQLKVRELAVTPGVDPRGQIASLDRAGLHLRGYLGNDARAHCNHLRLASQATRLIWAREPEAR